MQSTLEPHLGNASGGSRVVRRPLVAALVAGIVALATAACGDDSSSSSDPKCFDDPATTAISRQAVENFAGKGTTITLVTHDSFALSDGTLEKFTAQTGIEVRLLKRCDAGKRVR